MQLQDIFTSINFGLVNSGPITLYHLQIYVIVLTLYGYMNISLILCKTSGFQQTYCEGIISGLISIMLAWTGLASQLSGLLSSVPHHAAIFGGNPQLFSEQLPLRWLWSHSYLAKTRLTLLWIFDIDLFHCTIN